MFGERRLHRTNRAKPHQTVVRPSCTSSLHLATGPAVVAAAEPGVVAVWPGVVAVGPSVVVVGLGVSLLQPSPNGCAAAAAAGRAVPCSLRGEYLSSQ